MKPGEGSLVQIEDGKFVERDVLRVAQAVNDYDPNLKIQVLERPERLDEAPYRLIEKGKDGQWRVVFDIWQLDQRVLDRIYAIDTYKHDILGNLDRSNQKIKDEENRQKQELLGHQKELVRAIIDSPKDSYRVPVDGEIKTFRSIPGRN